MAMAEGDQAQQAVEPYRVAEGTYVVPQLMEAPPVGSFYLNSLVIQGREPVIVDTHADQPRRVAGAGVCARRPGGRAVGVLVP